MRNKFYTLRICSRRFLCVIFSFGLAVHEVKRENDGGGGKGERERPLYSANILSSVCKFSRGGRGKREGEEKERMREGSLTLSPQPPLPFSLSRYPQPLSTPATQAKRPPAFNPLRLSKRWRFFSLGTSATMTATAAKTSPKNGFRAVPNFVALIQTLLVSGFVPSLTFY